MGLTYLGVSVCGYDSSPTRQHAPETTLLLFRKTSLFLKPAPDTGPAAMTRIPNHGPDERKWERKSFLEYLQSRLENTRRRYFMTKGVSFQRSRRVQHTHSNDFSSAISRPEDGCHRAILLWKRSLTKFTKVLW